ncbi:ectonucleotide pyrophosphatase/phosphodiesterase family member 5 [Pseudoliparis swirei]|uniref:ectonucleotide pyrophosphatase/phosphodiesterase family member 5 n=1 Tax=Pseudoliparis swirei TaxID=2059687 RepID=UPI0024BD66C9|nr:ectonucleotide pyrophosphatase/phosphodiesterase family member 5 [Pseudoliparis swirei]
MPGCSLRGGGGPLVLLWALTLPLVSLQRPDRPKLLLLSFDGFRWDYIDRVPTPNFHNLIDDGVMVSHVENVYVTKTFPNHYSLVTGLYAETHGIVANEMYDPATGRSFSMETDSIYEPAWWEQAEPLWVTVQKAGGRSAAAMWPGSDVKIYGVYPSRYLPYNASVPFKDRVARIVRWFSGPEGEEVDFGVLYWEEPDESGHALGPQSPLMDPVITDIDEKLGFLVNALKEAGLYEKVNLVVTSDHGMAQLFPDKIIELDQYVTRDLYTWVDRSPVVALLPKEGKLDEVFGKLVDANPNMVVYKKEDVPERFHYRHNGRIMPILIEAMEGWTIMQNRTGPFMLGNHGYDNTLRSMQPVFVARGPAFRQNYLKDSMRSVDLYPLMCHILSVDPLPNNGSLPDVRDMLSQEPPLPPPTPGTPPSGAGSAAAAPRFDVPPGADAHSHSYAPLVGSLLGVVMVLGFLVVYIKQVTLKQLPSLHHRSREMSQPLLQEDLHL